MKYTVTCQFDRLIAINGWDTKHNALSIWGCEKSVMKKYGLRKIYVLSLLYSV